jgi:hypothetical protein
MSTNRDARKVLWQQRLEQWQSSGLSKAEWCRRTGTSKETLLYWQRKLNLFLPSAKHNKSEFIELADSPKTPSTSVSGIVIEYSGATIQLMQGFHLETLLECLRALRSI